MKFSFLVHNFYGVGGTNRAVLNLASALVDDGHEAEIASVFRRVDRTMFDVDERVSIVPLVDLRQRQRDRSAPQLREPSLLIPKSEEFYPQYSRLTDERLVRYLRHTDADVVVGTRPGLNLVVARHAPEHAVRVAQEHMTQDLIDDAVKTEIRRSYARIDLAYTVSNADADAFRTGNPVPGTEIKALANSAPRSSIPPADGRNRTIVAAGRLDPIKRYDRLIAAFAYAVRDCPGWQLRIYGDGEQRPGLARLVRELGMYGQVLLMGRREDMTAEWVKGSIAAVSSARESFGMTIVEAMRLGLPVVSSDCPVGPREIITHGEDGLLVPTDDFDEYARALRTLMRDDDLRIRMGAMAVANSARFDPANLANEFVRDCSRVLSARRAGLPRYPSGRKLLPPELTRSVSRSGELLREVGLARALADPVLRGIAENDLTRRASMGALVRLARVRRARSTSTRLQAAIRRRVSADADAPVADCVVTPDLGLRLTLDLTAGSGDDVSMLLSNRDTRDVVRAALVPSADGTRAVGTLDAAALSEGRWNAYLVDGKRVRHRLRPRQLDSRILCSAEATLVRPRGGVAVQVPYQTVDGFLAVRSWVRPVHAEASRLALDGEAVLVEFVWYGPGVPDAAVLHRRGDPTLSMDLPTTSAVDGTVSVAVPLTALADLRLSRHEKWDLFLRYGDDEVRLGRFADDVVDKKRTYSYPEIHLPDETTLDLVEEDPAPMLRICPYYTIDSELSFAVVDRP
ncbi:glycosyltransferase family 4 protein [Micromonospora radicis]|uniref:glycosyltransferase family 4 protein n=1 Tax=Micromonospora radicis TaxID=1894971 RepID=UPI001314B017|nr:glycosyltransferase family 4 protein [Micromonospora radicis]